MELLDIYNSKGEVTGKVIERGSKDLGPNEHIAVSIIYIENSDGKFLIQKTSESKGGNYSSTGGHIYNNETPKDAIIRETKEEIGLDISKDNIIDLGFICVDIPVRFIYYLKKDININDLVLDKEEVDSIYYFSIQELNKIINEGKMSKGHIVVLEKVLEYKKKIGD